MQDVNIVYLADYPEFIPELASWFRREWPEFASNHDPDAAFHRYCNRDCIPLALVAVEHGRPIGTVSLLSESVHSHRHLAPWIGGLYVVPSRRHEGIATRMISVALEKAKSLEFETVYVGINSGRELYQGSGWEYQGDGSANGETVMVFSKRLNPMKSD